MLATARRVAAFWRPHKGTALALVASLLLRALFTVVLAMSVKLIIDGVVGDGGGLSTGSIVVLLVAGFVISSAASLAGGYLTARVGADILAEVRTALFAHLQRLSLAFHSTAESGDLLARFSTDVAQLSDGVVKQPLAGLRSLVSLAFYFPVMMVLEPRLSLAALGAMPLAVYVVNRISPDADEALDDEKQQVAAVIEEVSESLQSLPTVLAFGLAGRARDRFSARIERLRAVSRRAEFRVQLLAVLSEFGVALVQLTIVGLGAVLALNGSMEPGTLAAFIALLTEFSWETNVIGSVVLPQIRKAASGIRRVDSLLATEAEMTPPTDPVAVPAISEDIRFERVGFTYVDGGPRQLSDVTVHIPAGAYTAIVGPSGSGKSTLLNLIMRFWDPSEGRVLVDGIDISSLDLHELRSRIGFVFADTFLFSGTLRENIAVGAPAASEADLAIAVERAGMVEFVAGLGHGLETRIGHGGQQVSGGERQRIGLARALVRHPQILLLDELTSALDPAAEAAVLENIARLRPGRTIVAVTHRLQTIADADTIIVMSGGRVEESGSFDELTGRAGAFASMWQKQQGFSVSGDGRVAEVTPDRLEMIPLFADLDQAIREGLAAGFRSDWIPSGSDVFVAGSRGDRFYVIARGVVEVIVPDGDGERVIAHLEDGDFFGEMALLADQPRNATVRAVVPTSLLSLDRVQFESLREVAPEAARSVRAIASERARANQP